MRTTMGWMLAAGVALAGCAAQHSSTRVGDEALARVPDKALGEVNALRMELAKANDTVARERLEVKSAEEELTLAKRDVDVAKAESKRADQLGKTAELDRDGARSAEARTDRADSSVQEKVADARIEANKATLELKKQNEKVARARARQLEAKLELAKYQALRDSGDPAVAGLDETRLENAVTAADSTLRQEENIRQERVQRATQLQQTLNASGNTGIGGAGE